MSRDTGARSFKCSVVRYPCAEQMRTEHREPKGPRTRAEPVPTTDQLELLDLVSRGDERLGANNQREGRWGSRGVLFWPGGLGDPAAPRDDRLEFADRAAPVLNNAPLHRG